MSRHRKLPFRLNPILAACAAAVLVSHAVAGPDKAFRIDPVWQYHHAATGVPGLKAEIDAYAKVSDTL
jgi:hypothetical protein